MDNVQENAVTDYNASSSKPFGFRLRKKHLGDRQVRRSRRIWENKTLKWILGKWVVRMTGG
jgi:hypothetical protein